MKRPNPIAQRYVLALVVLLAGAAPALGQYRSHKNVLAAFRDVVAEPAKSTVQVYADGYRAALGAVVRSDGYIVTKASELKGKIEAQLHDGRKLEAKVVGTDPTADLAVLHVEAKDLPTISWSDETTPVGSWVVTTGLGRDPVAIGVLNVGPRKIDAPSGALGVRLTDAEDEARILSVIPNMAADEAGIRDGDLILEVDGTKIAGRQKLQEIIKSHMPGEKLRVLIRRGSEELSVTVTLSSFRQFETGDRADFQNNLGGDLSERRAGFPSVIQHDTVLRPMDCGGPIVDLDGKAVGLNIARAGRVESYALPATVVRESVARLINTELVAAPAAESPASEKAAAEKATAPAEVRER